MLAKPYDAKQGLLGVLAKPYNAKQGLLGVLAKAASFVAKLSHISKNKSLNKKRRMDDCLREVLLK